MFTFGASYQDQGNRGRGTDQSIMGVAARLSLGDFGAAANCVTEDVTGDTDRDTVSAVLDYQIEKACTCARINRLHRR